ncbi:NAD(P)-dependent alcohol dehydrogenase [Streptomyces sp. AK02-01A]|uniref:NAD(P)-dependent alcohol dehydrogenase n=1 Tax=Streptomyces sp. AK02-01A TaxID=3028648 RepID=UPI0029A591B5|nr:NAD(P)-dependent alcohol dehydrogenase [Streptomyces sp. AK02-01A]MDX3853927.1 NAD(P)-dependent alcohol dehydrogenase [Streptomyces sp. AK02-01A]
MTTQVPALAAPSAKAPLRPTAIERRAPGPHDVVIDIAYTGICHTDLALLHEEWGAGMVFPMVPGHEIAGHVSAVGTDVSRHAVGDRVGVGCYVDSCRECGACLAGQEQHCLKGEVLTYGGVDYQGRPTYGGYSRQIVVDENYVLHIPDALSLQGAAPLLCAGITMYNPLRRWNAGPGTKVAVIGMGGLGHVGIKLAHAMGAEVTALGRSLAKRDDGLRFGADDYRATSDSATFTELAESFDLVVNTVGAGGGLDAYLNLLRLDGVLVNAGVSTEPLDFHGPLLGDKRRIIASTKNGGVGQCQEMLDFCARHGITAETETVAADQVNTALDRLDRGDVRYRFVIDTATITASA